MMHDYLEDEALFQKAMEGMPMSTEMPQELREKATNLALESSRKQKAVRRPYLVAYMTAGAAALALGVYFLAPKPAVAKSWGLVKQAIEDASTFRMLVHQTGG